MNKIKLIGNGKYSIVPMMAFDRAKFNNVIKAQSNLKENNGY